AALSDKGIPKKAVHIRNLVLGCEFLMSSMTHFYHLAAPSYVQGPNMAPWTPYFNDAFYSPLLRSAGKGTASGTLPGETLTFSTDLWSAVIKQYVKALRIRRLTFEAGALFAGRMPMTSCFVAGGVTFPASEDLNVAGGKCDKFKSMLDEIGTFVVREYVPLVLALGALYGDFDNAGNSGFNPDGMVTARPGKGYGAGVGNFLAWGGFPIVSDTVGVQALTFPRGFKLGAALKQDITVADVGTQMRESVYSSYYASVVGGIAETGFTGTSSEPLKVVRTVPDREATTGYSWLKSPRWNDNAMEVGPLARLAVAGLYPVNQTAIAAGGLSVYYLLYTKTVNSITGLDPKMIEPDLAVALLRSGLATLTNGGTVYGIGTGETALPLTADEIAAAYYHADTVITGIVAGWVIGLKGGLSTMDRLRARALESLFLMINMIGAPSKAATGIVWDGTGWIQGLKALGTAATFIAKDYPVGGSTGTFGATEAPRGALLHTCSINAAGKISAYQCVVPTTWNASPKSTSNVLSRGPIEQAMMGIPYANQTVLMPTQAGGTQTAEGGVEALRVAQSFDPCIACAVH
ncbi:MAG: nickel-dependent hydrogenase large subunit, partial [Actinomycetota bacterium]|nr:nickel-dependent hydrogenase large subunit [Actinomycetota bacterium]